MPSTLTACNGDIDDIEDCVSLGDLPKPSERLKLDNRILPRALRRKATRSGPAEQAVGDSFIPGTHSIYIKTWGCSHNNSDGEYMAGLLGASGYTITGEPLRAAAVSEVCVYGGRGVQSEYSFSSSGRRITMS